MSPLEQEQLLEQTRAQIRQQVAEIAELARRSRHGVPFFREFIARVAAVLNAEGGAVWLPGETGECQLIAEHNFGSSGYHENEKQRRDIHRVLAETLKSRRGFIVGAVSADVAPPPPGRTADEEIGNTTPYPMFYVPVMVAENQVGVLVQVWLKSAGDSKTYPAMVTFLNQVCVHAGTFLKARQTEMSIARNQEYEHLIHCLGDYVGELDPKKVGRATVNHFTDFFGASRCSLFHLAGGKWRLEFVSNQETIDQRSELVGNLCEFAGRLPAADAPAAISLDAPEEGSNWGEVLEPLGTRQAAYAFFEGRPHEGRTGLVLLERHAANAPFTPITLRQLQWVSGQLGRALLAAHTYREVPFRRVLHPVTHARGMWRRRRRVRLAAWLCAPVALLALWLLIPWTLRVEGDCTIQPRRQVTVAAQTTGKIEAVNADEGRFYEKGALLAKLEDDDLRTQIAVTLQELSKWQSEVNRYQSNNEETQRAVADIERRTSQARLDRLKFLQTRTELRAPISGVVLTKNLANRVGESLEVGKPFCEMAATDLYEVDIDLRQQDLGVVLEALHRRKDLPMDFILQAHTDTRLHTVIHGTEAISETAHVKPGGSFFSVRADFPVDAGLAASLKPGYTGKAKIELGRHPLAAVMMRKFLDYWRVEWGF